MNKPIYTELSIPLEPAKLFSIFAAENGAILLESARLQTHVARYSFIAIDPFLTISAKNNIVSMNQEQTSDNPFDLLKSQMSLFHLESCENLPPFQGGVAGFFSYELNHYLEILPLVQNDPLLFPDLAVGFYDIVIAFDHQLKRTWIFSSGFPELATHAREKRAKMRLEHYKEKILKAFEEPNDFAKEETSEEKYLHELKSNFTQNEYEKLVDKTLAYIYAGDIFQANISQCFSMPLPRDFSPIGLYFKLRSVNPAPFAAYISLADTCLLSASPERFLSISKGKVEVRPIKGTRPRSTDLMQDQLFSTELIESEKDRAENIMIVDLMRNDLSRVCVEHSIDVPQLCGLESFATVHHLVSVVTGQLKPEFDAIDVLKATFPGGSITGAPKIRAMEIITELENTARGPYCGCIGYLAFNGDSDLSIVIRTFAIRNDCLSFHVGGGIVSDSEPLAEYQETLVKALGLKKALGSY